MMISRSSRDCQRCNKAGNGLHARRVKCCACGKLCHSCCIRGGECHVCRGNRIRKRKAASLAMLTALEQVDVLLENQHRIAPGDIERVHRVVQAAIAKAKEEK